MSFFSGVFALKTFVMPDISSVPFYGQEGGRVP